MIILAQQETAAGAWEDVDVPDGIDRVEDWANRLVELGVTGEFRALQKEGGGDVDDVQFRIRPVTKCVVDYAKESD